MKSRTPLRLRNYDYSTEGAYFITVCTYKREHLFGEVVHGTMECNEFGKIVLWYWEQLPAHYSNICVDEFVIMPNHIHVIIIITDNEQDANKPVGGIHEFPQQETNEFPQQETNEFPLQETNEFRQQQANSWLEWRNERRRMLLPKIIGRLKMQSAKEINVTRGTTGVPVWQRNYYEHVIRNEKSLNNIRAYIRNNPANWLTDTNNTKHKQ